ncbi:hypothetical protein SCLCIDRAFT_145643, partial [Scleroderma citrinum Foug A]
CACARHGCFVPHAMVDFQKGEQQVNMDYALVHAYSRNLVRRIWSNDFISLPDGLQILPGIRIWHVHGHKSECFPQYALNFIPGAGRVDGEIMETLWSSLNIISPSARGMATPHRQELLGFQMSDSNFLKMVQMHEWTNVLIRLTCCADIEVTEAFDKLNNQVPESLRMLWSEQQTKALNDWLMDPRAMDIYDVQLEKAPTMKSLEMNLINWPQDQLRGSATWLAKALKVEEAQIMLAIDAHQANTSGMENQQLSIARQWDQLQSQLDGLVVSAARFLGKDWEDEMLTEIASNITQDYEIENPFGNVESILPPLPSYIGVEWLQELGLEILVDQELSLRQGQANDCLHEIRLALADKSIIFQQDVRHA